MHFLLFPKETHSLANTSLCSNMTNWKALPLKSSCLMTLKKALSNNILNSKLSFPLLYRKVYMPVTY